MLHFAMCREVGCDSFLQPSWKQTDFYSPKIAIADLWTLINYKWTLYFEWHSSSCICTSFYNGQGETLLHWCSKVHKVDVTLVILSLSDNSSAIGLLLSSENILTCYYASLAWGVNHPWRVISCNQMLFSVWALLLNRVWLFNQLRIREHLERGGIFR